MHYEQFLLAFLIAFYLPHSANAWRNKKQLPGAPIDEPQWHTAYGDGQWKPQPQTDNGMWGSTSPRGESWGAMLPGDTQHELTLPNDLKSESEEPSEDPWKTGVMPMVPKPLAKQSQIAFDCLHKPDGMYPNPWKPCDVSYFACSGGRTVKMTCSKPLYFDPDVQICNAHAHVEVCSGRRRREKTTDHQPTPQQSTVEFDCSTLPDGNYVNPKADPTGCSSVYYGCTGHETQVFECDVDLAYDPKTDLCDRLVNVEACGGQPRPPLSPTNAVRPVPYSIFDCTGLDNGFYANPSELCSKTYFSCSGRGASQLTCPDELAFDTHALACLPYKTVFACSGDRPPHSEKRESAPKSKTGSTSTSDFDCRKRSNGMYANEKKLCSKTYFMCSNAIATKHTCAKGTHFDPKLMVCNYFHNISVCKKSTERIKPLPSDDEAAPRPQEVASDDSLAPVFGTVADHGTTHDGSATPIDSEPFDGSTHFDGSVPFDGSDPFSRSIPYDGSTSSDDSMPYVGSTSLDSWAPHDGSIPPDASAPYDGVPRSNHWAPTPYDGSTTYDASDLTGAISHTS